MTSAKVTAIKPKPQGWFRFPYPPEIPDEKMTAFDQLSINGNAYLLAQHLGNPETTLVAGEHYLSLRFTRRLAGVRYPDLLVAFGVDPDAYRRTNAYVIEEQGKPPDFVLEIASPSTRRVDDGPKREEYAALGIPEYWRFDGRTQGPEIAAGGRPAGGRGVPADCRRGAGRRRRAGITAPRWAYTFAGSGDRTGLDWTRQRAVPSLAWPASAPGLTASAWLAWPQRPASGELEEGA